MCIAKRAWLVGVSLFEVNVALIVSAIILSMIPHVIGMFLKVDDKQAQLAELEDKLITAMHWLQKDINHAGYLGCVNAGKRTDDVLPGEALQIIDGNQLLIKRMSLLSSEVKNIQGNTVRVKSVEKFKVNNAVLLADCFHAEKNVVFGVAKLAGEQWITLKSALIYSYSKHVMLGKFVSHRYFVKSTNRVTKSGAPIHALYMEDERGKDHELVDGIDSISFSLAENNRIDVTLQANVDGESKYFKFSVKLENA